MKLKITGYSTALFATWYFIDELALLFDAGDGVTSGLLQKSRKVKHVFISHADRDHLTGLLQFNQLNARGAFPKIHFPKDSKSFSFLEKFTQNFDPHIKGSSWIGLEENQVIKIKENIFVETFRNEHIVAPTDQVKSLSFHVFQTKRKLREEYLNLSGKEIKELRDKRGTENITYEVRENILSYSGDTPVENDGRWNQTKVLIHEATFLDKVDEAEDHRSGKHSHLADVLNMVAGTNVEKLILGHFSSRYSPEEIDERILNLCKKFQIKIPVFRILPGAVATDILNGIPINQSM